ncbi:MAG: phosphoribosylglycinamide formyltransferase [Verrucomicrobia bacterium]|nr:phosphoribosylglycinamide formyltransferase [Verrucomicrobiota bacterium]
MNRRLKIGVLGSGKGSNFKAIMERIIDGKLPAEVRLVISDVPDSGILSYARDFQVPALFVNPGKYRTRLEAEVEHDIARLLQEAGVELVVLAGFMRVLKEPLLKAFPKSIINIHPSLLPKFKGLEAWKQALDAGEKVTGCTVHYVDPAVDAGHILGQREIAIQPDDTAASLHARIQEAEHDLLPEVVRQIAMDRIRS